MPLPREDELHTILKDQVDVRGKAAGMVAGVLSPDGRHIAAHGVLERGLPGPVTSDTVFTIASITKVFPAILLADMVRRREVALTDPVERHLPGGFPLPRRKGREITLVDLATHTSGLPPQPADFPTLDHPGGAAYSREQLYRAVAGHALTRDIGSEWQYGNVDIALLAHALAHRAGLDFETLVHERITGPLGMTSTAFQPSPSMAARLASGHDSDLRPVARLTLGALAPAGGMLSSANDLLKLAAALLDIVPSSFAVLLPSMLEVRRSIRPSLGTMLRDNWRLILRMLLRPPRGAPASVRYFSRAEGAIGWFVLGRGREELVVHDGAGPQCAASLALDRASRSAAVVLSNTGRAVNDLSRHLLRRDYPLSDARPDVPIDRASQDRYSGRYVAPNGMGFDVARDGDRLTVALPSFGRVPLRARADREFAVAETGFDFWFAAERPVREMWFRATPSLPFVPLRRAG